ncbi:perforin-1-like [Eucyclogobius newberryi]|uniref:perforin-1-like n=1 Tax=Eucyclogobius newberryi TaxID=166745 RepID=UPI003B5BD71E
MTSPLPLLLLLLGVSLSQAQLRIYDLRASGLDADPTTRADGYVKVFCNGASLGQTSFKKDEANPWWSEEFTYYNTQGNILLKLEVHDRDLMYDDWLGGCERTVKAGTHRENCPLQKGGTLYFSYTLN